MLTYKKKTLFYLVTVVLFLVNCSPSEIPLQNNRQFQVKEKTSDTLSPIPNPLPTTKDKWQAATFHGLVMGKAKVSDLKKALGEPLEVADLKSVGNNDDTLYYYESKEEIIGKIVAWVDKKSQIVFSIELRPDSMSRTDVLKHFGNNYAITRYSSGDCPGTTFDSAPLYEDPNGETRFIEYRNKGIAILISEDDDTVQYISYLSKPVGSESSKCK